MNTKKRERKKKVRSICNTLFLILCCIGLLVLVFQSIAKIVKEKSEEASDTQSNTEWVVNNAILNENVDQIYEETAVTKQNKINSLSGFIDKSTDETLDEIAGILPLIKQKYEAGEWEYLYSKIKISVVNNLGATTDEETFQNQIKKLNNITTHKTVTLQFHNVQKVSELYICPVSIVGIKENTKGNMLYDYDNVVETVFTIYKEGDIFKWLPYNVKMGLVIDNYSIFY